MANSALDLILKNPLVVGLDEAGRGCLAGPVYAGAVILKSGKGLAKIRDSKKMSEDAREKIFAEIIGEHRVGVGFATVEEIAQLNILQASLLAMKRAFEDLKLNAADLAACHVLVDGNQKVRGLTSPQTTVIGGDDKVKAISAASIVAKVLRDRRLRELDQEFPQYGYAKHKGYGTAEHLKAIAEFGVTVHHRTTFAGVREHVVRTNAAVTPEPAFSF